MTEPRPAKRKRAKEGQEETQSTSRHDLENFARFADVTFILQDEIRVCVNSVIMKTASPVFAAMLDPHFKKGHALTQAKNVPVEIALPKDDAGAFGHICQVLHCQADTTLLEPNPDMLLKIWILIQKYDLKKAIKLSIEHWVRRQLELRLELEDLWLLALFCFQFEEATAFQYVTQQLMLSANLPFVKLATKLEERTKGFVWASWRR
ncbi:uncharacterized protein FTOL_02906 [Fusarium torulosum]|uniref:BTB domain-containing protein n=1 Tax=Fusarium torulosum TaxID=33205 RepID=A0AAE8M2X3_9HYPO|nr:uncharacterized protein FTOL_02906 [Fusarium torulosum]